MYDFPEVRDSTQKLLTAFVDALASCGQVVHVETPDGLVHEKLMEMWRSNQTALSQSCGLPFVEDLHEHVDVVGTFLWTDVSDPQGRYQTVIVAREALDVSNICELGGLRPVVSNTQSLSGWCSLGVALAEAKFAKNSVQPYVMSGGHARSLQMLQDGEADIASIDSATYQLLSRHRPALVNNVRVIGYGPMVPATPIIVSKSSEVDTGEVYRVVSELFGRADLRAALGNIGISGFVRLTNNDYDGVMELVKTAEVVLPRR